MTTITKKSITGAFCKTIGPWFEEMFGESADEIDVVALAAEQGHIDAVCEYIRNVLVEENTVERCVVALASLPAVDGDPWKEVVDEASGGDPDAEKIRTVIQGWPHDDHVVYATTMVARIAIMHQEEATISGHWTDLLTAVRAV